MQEGARPDDPAARGRFAATTVPAGVWRADALVGGPMRTVPSNHAPLDAELPGGGWPLGALIELLPAGGEAPVWPLLLPALAAYQQVRGTMLALVNPPHEPFVPALAAGGIRPADVLWLTGATPAAGLWLTEQALGCADVAAVLAWLPRARTADLRRLQLAAARRGDGLLFVLRPAQAAAFASPAPLRLQLDVAADGAGGVLGLRLRLLKRRGPALAEALSLPAQLPGLRALLSAGAPVAPQVVSKGGDDVVVRLALAA